MSALIGPATFGLDPNLEDRKLSVMKRARPTKTALSSWRE